MPFTSYATLTDINAYVNNAVDELWGNDEDRATDALLRGAREVNERLRGMDRFAVADIPVGVEADGSYAEILIRLNVYHAVWLAVTSAYAGEAFDRHWDWLRININQAWKNLEDGVYLFGGEVSEKSTQASKEIHLRRQTV